MKSHASSTFTAASLALLANIAAACNPYLDSGCISTNPALGKTTTIDFTQQSSDFSSTGGPITYGSNGAVLSVTASGVAPTLISNWYIMFGKFEIVMQVAPGAGLVSSAILQSDDLDEIDWEILGSTPTVAQTNYFGKGLTTSYDRESDTAAANNPPTFHTYTIDWNAERIIWSVDGNAERTLTAANADPGQYPQTPMQIKIGPWAGGDQSNSALGAGTIAWATANSGVYTNWADAPFNMYVKSVTVEDYSTGTDYTYSGAAFMKSGDYQLVTAQGGSVNGGVTAGSAGSSSPSSSSPVSSSTASGQVSANPTSEPALQPAHTGYPWVPFSPSSTLVPSSSPSSLVSHPIMEASTSSGTAIDAPVYLLLLLGSTITALARMF